MITPELLSQIPKCDTCGMYTLTEECQHCRALRAERVVGDYKAPDIWLSSIERLAVGLEGKDALYPLGFSLDLKSGATRIVSRPQAIVRPVFLTIAPECASGMIIDMKVGNRSQGIGSYPLPMSVFNPHNWIDISLMPRLACDTCLVAQDITLVIEPYLPKYDPLVSVAMEADGKPHNVDYFHAIMWCKTAVQSSVEVR